MSLFLLNSRQQLSLQLPWWKMHACACTPLSCHSSLFSSMLPSHLPTSRSNFHIPVQFWNQLQFSPTRSHGSVGNDLGSTRGVVLGSISVYSFSPRHTLAIGAIPDFCLSLLGSKHSCLPLLGNADPKNTLGHGFLQKANQRGLTSLTLRSYFQLAF